MVLPLEFGRLGNEDSNFFLNLWKLEKSLPNFNIKFNVGAVDAGDVDAGAVDAGAVDAGAVDAGAVYTATIFLNKI